MLKALVSLQSLIKSIVDVPQVSLRQSLSSLFNQSWTVCQKLFESHANDPEMVQANCDYVLEVLCCLP